MPQTECRFSSSFSEEGRYKENSRFKGKSISMKQVQQEAVDMLRSKLIDLDYLEEQVSLRVQSSFSTSLRVVSDLCKESNHPYPSAGLCKTLG